MRPLLIPRERVLRGLALAHTCATLALQAGVNVRVVAERLGHANASITLDTYAHVVAGAQDEATAKLETLLGG